MIKRKEAVDPTSYFNRADRDEMLFILLGRDKSAPDTIRFWCRKRIELGKNKPNDTQIITALRVAEQMEKDYKLI